MSCAEIQELFSDACDSVLEVADRIRLESHLRDCPDCLASYEAYHRMLNEVRSLPEPSLPDHFHQEVMTRIHSLQPPKREPMARIRSVRPPKRDWRAALKPYTWAAASVCACFIMISILTAGISAITTRQPSTASSASVFTAGLDDSGVGAGEASDEIGLMEAKEVSDAEGVVLLEAAGAPLARSVAGNDRESVLLGGYFELNFDISITVDDLQQAADVIDALNGYNVSASMDYNGYGGSTNYGQFRRKVDAAAYEHVKTVLRSLGTVDNETEHANRLATDVFDLEAQLTAKEQEISRLMELLGKSLTIDVLTSVERRLGQVETERDELRGQLNNLYGVTAHPYINITLYETPSDPVVLTEETFGERVVYSFTRSMNFCIKFMENSLVFLSGAFLPLLFLAVLAGFAAVIVRTRLRKRPEQEPLQDAVPHGTDSGEEEHRS